MFLKATYESLNPLPLGHMKSHNVQHLLTFSPEYITFPNSLCRMSLELVLHWQVVRSQVMSANAEGRAVCGFFTTESWDYLLLFPISYYRRKINSKRE